MFEGRGGFFLPQGYTLDPRFLGGIKKNEQHKQSELLITQLADMKRQIEELKEQLKNRGEK